MYWRLSNPPSPALSFDDDARPGRSAARPAACLPVCLLACLLACGPTRYQTIITPASWAFAIWGVIFPAELVFAVVQCLPAARDSELVTSGVGWGWVLTVLFQSAWQLAFALESLEASTAFLFAAFLSLFGVSITNDRANNHALLLLHLLGLASRRGRKGLLRVHESGAGGCCLLFLFCLSHRQCTDPPAVLLGMTTNEPTGRLLFLFGLKRMRMRMRMRQKLDRAPLGPARAAGRHVDFSGPCLPPALRGALRLVSSRIEKSLNATRLSIMAISGYFD